MLTLELLGPARVRRDGDVVTRFRSRKALVLLAVLAGSPGPVLRSSLVALLWPDSPPQAGRAELSRLLFDLRQRLGAALTADRHTVSLAGDDVEHDLDRLEQAVAARTPAGWAEGVHLYRGPLLADVEVADPELALWLDVERARHARRVSELLERLTSAALGRGDRHGVLTWTQRWLQHDPHDERAHRFRLRELAAAGRAGAALREHQALSDRLVRELGARPDPETERLVDDIRGGRLLPRARRLTPLEAPLTALLGRQALLDRVLDAVTGPDRRLVTLLGPGGVGKTRLAQEVALLVDSSGEAAVALVELAAVNDMAEVPEVLRAALRLEPRGDPVAALVEALAGQPVLLVLDNLEQIPASGTPIRALLHQLPALRVLATSRGPLRIRGELQVPVPPLDADAGAALFTARAQEAGQSTAELRDDPETLAQLCGLLDGLPLAIELAAAQLRRSTAAALLRRLGSDLPDLPALEADRPDRHRSLRATVTWSAELLSGAARTLFADLAVARGGVGEVLARRLAGPEAERLLDELLDAGLLQVQRSDPPRLGLLPTVAAVAHDELVQRGRLDVARDRHAAVLLQLAEESARPGLVGGTDQVDRLSLLEAERDNLRAALQHVGAGPADALPRWVDALIPTWLLRRNPRDAVLWLRAVLERAGELDDRTVAAACSLVVMFAPLVVGSDVEPEATRLEGLRPGPVVDAWRLAARAATAGHRADTAAFAVAAAAAAAAAREAGLPQLELMQRLSLAALDQGDGRTEGRHSAEGLALSIAVDDVVWRPTLLSSVARVALSQGRTTDAARHLTEALGLGRRLGTTSTIRYMLLWAVQLALAVDRPTTGGQLLGAMEVFDHRSSERWLITVRGIRQETRTAVEEALGPAGTAEAVAAGHRLSLTAVIDLVAGLGAAGAPGSPP